MASSAPINETLVFEGLTFNELAEHIDSKLDREIEKQLKNLNIFNTFLDQPVFGTDKFIPVGSCVDMSKVNTPNDPGDLDFLILARKVKLKEELFDYDNDYPAFLHIKNDGEHTIIFAKSELPHEQRYLPVKVLKSMEYLHGLTKWFAKCVSMEGLDGNVLKLKMNTAVGVECSRLDSQPLHSTGVFDDCQRHKSTWNFAVPRMSKAMKYVLERMQNLPAHQNEHSNSDIKSDASDNQPIPETFLRAANEVLDSLSKENRGQSQNPAIHRETGNTNLHKETEDLSGTEENEEITGTCLTQNNPDSTKNNINDCILTKRISVADNVPAFQVEGWPRVAEKWVYRKRYWPPKWAIGNAVNVGCQVVAKRPFALSETPEQPDTDTYFRLSFALVEIELAKSMNEVQIKCWRILKAYQKAFLQSKSKVLTSYLWKNVLFWVCERCHLSFWTNDNLIVGVKICLKFMSQCLEMGVLSFYFVPRMNLLNGRNKDEMLQVKGKLDLIQEDPKEFLRRFFDNHPYPEQYGVDLNNIEKTMSYGEVADRHDDVIKQMVDAFFLEIFPGMENADSDGFLDHVLAFNQKLIRTAKESKEETKMREMGVQVEDAKSLEKTQAESKLMKCFERMDFSRQSFKSIIEAFSHNAEVSIAGVEGKDKNKQILDLLMSMFKGFPAIMDGDEEALRTSLCKALQAGNEITRSTEAKLKENMKSGETAEDEKQKKKTLLSLVSEVDKILSGTRSTVLPDQKQDNPNKKEVPVYLSDIELD